MSLLRLMERLMGEGAVSRDGTPMGRLAYELSRYGEFEVVDGALEPRGDVVEGHLHASPDVLNDLVGMSAPLTIALEDGRRCDVYVVNVEGAVTGADSRGFYAW